MHNLLGFLDMELFLNWKEDRFGHLMPPGIGRERDRDAGKLG